MTELNAEKRERVNKRENVRLRKEGRIPAVFYGRKEEATPISISAAEFEKAWKEAGESTVLTLKGLGDDKDVLIHEVDVEPIYGAARHVDLYVVDRNKPVQVPVELVFEGVAPAEKELGGTVIKVLHEIEIEALPRNLPHEIVVDISSLKDFESQILVQDLKLPEGVTAITEAEEVVATVSEAKEETEEAPTADVSQVEISEERGKKEEEGASE
jgi:large subunit ribosomal protein L25